MLGQSGHEGTILATQSYGAFGNSLGQTGSSSNNRLKYTGREEDQDIGLYQYRARYYDPGVGRYISEDPKGFGGGVNFYVYTDNNPVNANDPSGLITFTFGADVHIPAWLVKAAEVVGVNTVPVNGFQIGVAESFNLFDGAERDSGIYIGPQIPGIDIGVGKLSLSFGLSPGSVKDLTGNSDITSSLTLPGFSAGFSLDADTAQFKGLNIGVGVGAGFNLGQTIDVTTVLSGRHGLISDSGFSAGNVKGTPISLPPSTKCVIPCR